MRSGVNGQVDVDVAGGGQVKVPAPRADWFLFRVVPPLARASHAVGVAAGDDDACVVQEVVQEADGGGVLFGCPPLGLRGAQEIGREVANRGQLQPRQPVGEIGCQRRRRGGHGRMERRACSQCRLRQRPPGTRPRMSRSRRTDSPRGVQRQSRSQIRISRETPLPLREQETGQGSQYMQTPPDLPGLARSVSAGEKLSVRLSQTPCSWLSSTLAAALHPASG